MNETLKLLEEHPKVTKLIIDWFAEKLERGMKNDDITEEVKEFMKSTAITNTTIAGIFNDSPRSLFDFFDTNKIFINIFPSDDLFHFSIGIIENDKAYKTRIEADKAAISKAFKLLETKLFS